jgi:hypothetical protein
MHESLALVAPPQSNGSVIPSNLLRPLGPNTMHRPGHGRGKETQYQCPPDKPPAQRATKSTICL